MAAAAPVEKQEEASQDEAGPGLVFEKCENVSKMIEELRGISTDSQEQLDEVNQYLEKLEKDDAKWNPEVNDPIVAFNLENLRQAFRETITFTRRYKAACKTLDHYLLKLEQHICAIEDKLMDVNAMDGNEPLMDCITQCIDRCCTQVGEYGSKYDCLNTQLNAILSKYCAPQAVSNDVTYLWCVSMPGFLQSLFEDSQTDSNKQPLHAQIAELQTARQKVTEVTENSKIIKTRWIGQQEVLRSQFLSA